MCLDVERAEMLQKLVAFRQALYQHGLTKRRDAQWEILDALLGQEQCARSPS